MSRTKDKIRKKCLKYTFYCKIYNFILSIIAMGLKVVKKHVLSSFMLSQCVKFDLSWRKSGNFCFKIGELGNLKVQISFLPGLARAKILILFT